MREQEMVDKPDGMTGNPHHSHGNEEGEVPMNGETSDVVARQISQLAQQVTEALAAAQSASQTAQQSAQAVNQVISDMRQTLSSQATQVLQEETGFAERLQTSGTHHTELGMANSKSRFDDYIQDLAELRDQTRGHVARLQVAAEQAIQNMIANNNLVANNTIAQTNNVNQQIARLIANSVGYDALGHAQAYAHRDIAIESQWGIKETDHAASLLLRAAEGPYGKPQFVDPSES